MHTGENNFWYYVLVTLKRISLSKKNRWLNDFGGPKELILLSEEDIHGIEGIEEKEIDDLLLYRRNPCYFQNKYNELQNNDIKFLSREDDLFPENLLYINSPPLGIFYKGNLPNPMRKKVAMVGARACSPYGKSIAKEMAKALAYSDVEVISGLARGIDGYSHRGALDGGGATFAVLAGGVDVIYPRENTLLYDEILRNDGGIISEYPPGTVPINYMFPERNRLISALSDAVIIVEAREKSGSLITGDRALEQGKEIFLVPGRLNDPLSKGANEFIRQGGQIITGIPELLEDLHVVNENRHCLKPKRKLILEKEESLVYSCLRLTPKGLDELMLESKLSLNTVIYTVSKLVDKGLAEEYYINQFIRS